MVNQCTQLSAFSHSTSDNDVSLRISEACKKLYKKGILITPPAFIAKFLHTVVEME